MTFMWCVRRPTWDGAAREGMARGVCAVHITRVAAVFPLLCRG